MGEQGASTPQVTTTGATPSSSAAPSPAFVPSQSPPRTARVTASTPEAASARICSGSVAAADGPFDGVDVGGGEHPRRRCARS
jgi:hypothetical protein